MKKMKQIKIKNPALSDKMAMPKIQQFRIFNPEENKFYYSGGTPMMLSGFFQMTAPIFTCLGMPYERKSEFVDSNGTCVYEGDILQLRFPYRSGDYPELTEPEIDTIKASVVFVCGKLMLQSEKERIDGGRIYFDSLDEYMNKKYDRDELLYAYQVYGDDLRNDDVWDDKDEGLLQYLLTWYPPNSEKELIDYLEEVAVVGNIHESVVMI